MQRILFRHLSGSKANQVEEFSADQNSQLTFGREAGVNVQYDPARDDLVSRQHARIERDANDPNSYFIEDLGSRNGTFLNKQRLTGRAAIAPGDVVQFGPGGPEFQFDLDPRPDVAARTREVSAADLLGAGAAGGAGAASTRESNAFDASVPSASVPVSSVTSANSPTMPPATGEVRPTVGKQTVERMITQTKKEGQKTTLFVALGAAGLVALVGGLLLMRSMQAERANQAQLAAAQSEIASTKEDLEKANAEAEEARENAPLAPTAIVQENADAVARLEVGWKLIYTPNGNQVYHEFLPNKNPNTGQPLVPVNQPELALYVETPDGTIEPMLTTNVNNHPIGGEHTGSGFAVTSDGFMLTNRHVAATWKTAYRFPDYASPGIVRRANGKFELLQTAPPSWVPSETKQAGQKLQGGFEGRNDYLYATFPGDSSRNPARLARVSDRHDVAMIKIDTPGTVDKVEFNDNYDSIQPGDAQIVLGYPAVSPPVYGVVRSQDVFNRSAQLREIPDPTVSVGNVGRVLRGDEDSDKGVDPSFSMFGDAYQLTINSTGGGNSGGPVFDDKGRVTGIFFAGGGASGANVTFAVPIRYGEELMNASSKRKRRNSSDSQDEKPAVDEEANADEEKPAADEEA